MNTEYLKEFVVLAETKNIFFGKGLDKPVEIVYTKVTLIKKRNFGFYPQAGCNFSDHSKTQPPAKVKTYPP